MTIWLDSVEDAFSKANSWTKHHRNILHGFLGYAILFYGGHFSNLILFSNSMAIVGLPIIQQHGKELVNSWQRTRAAIKEEAPLLKANAKDVAQHLNRLRDIRRKLTVAKAQYKAGIISPSEFQVLTKDLNIELMALDHAADDASSAFKVIANAADTKALQGIALQTYSAILAHLAAESHESVKAITLGLNVGSIVGERLTLVVHSIQKNLMSKQSTAELSVTIDELNKWSRTAIHGVSRVLGVVGSFILRRAALVFSGCMLGSHMLIQSVQTAIDPLLIAANLSTLKSNPELTTAVQFALVGIGFSRQLTGNSLPAFLRTLLSPLIAADLAITALFMRNGNR
jgi:hypothetical protein